MHPSNTIDYVAIRRCVVRIKHPDRFASNRAAIPSPDCLKASATGRVASLGASAIGAPFVMVPFYGVTQKGIR